VANKNQQAEQALYSIGGLYEIERQARDMTMKIDANTPGKGGTDHQSAA
jgi:hypothetical protein